MRRPSRPDEAISWLPLCVKQATKFVPKAEEKAEHSNGWFNMPAGAEFDDLVQVGMEKVVELLAVGSYPSTASIKNTLTDHLRVVFKQRGESYV